jgi:hypothetical protein
LEQTQPESRRSTRSERPKEANRITRAKGAIAWRSLNCASPLWQSLNVNRQHIIATLREHEPELKAAGIVHLRLFGSVAREEATGNSDIDLMADFDKSRRLTLVKVGSLQSRLTDILGANVDLSSPEWMKEPVKSKALREALLAF